MSNIRQRFAKDKVTFWASGYDPMDPEGGNGSVDVVSCSYKIGGEVKTDSAGQEFTPKTVIYLTGNIAKINQYAAIGDFGTSVNPVGDAEKVRRIETKTPLRGSQVYTVYTG